MIARAQAIQLEADLAGPVVGHLGELGARAAQQLFEVLVDLVSQPGGGDGFAAVARRRTIRAAAGRQQDDPENTEAREELAHAEPPGTEREPRRAYCPPQL